MNFFSDLLLKWKCIRSEDGRPMIWQQTRSALNEVSFLFLTLLLFWVDEYQSCFCQYSASSYVLTAVLSESKPLNKAWTSSYWKSSDHSTSSAAGLPHNHFYCKSFEIFASLCEGGSFRAQLCTADLKSSDFINDGCTDSLSWRIRVAVDIDQPCWQDVLTPFL